MAAAVVPSTSFTSSLRRSSHFGRGLQSLHAASLRVPGMSLRAMPSVCSKLTTSSSSASTEEPVAVGGSLLAGKIAAYVKRLYFLWFWEQLFHLIVVMLWTMDAVTIFELLDSRWKSGIYEIWSLAESAVLWNTYTASRYSLPLHDSTMAFWY
jgi:hypothetical protein